MNKKGVSTATWIIIGLFIALGAILLLLHGAGLLSISPIDTRITVNSEIDGIPLTITAPNGSIAQPLGNDWYYLGTGQISNQGYDTSVTIKTYNTFSLSGKICVDLSSKNYEAAAIQLTYLSSGSASDTNHAETFTSPAGTISCQASQAGTGSSCTVNNNMVFTIKKEPISGTYLLDDNQGHQAMMNNAPTNLCFTTAASSDGKGSIVKQGITIRSITIQETTTGSSNTGGTTTSGGSTGTGSSNDNGTTGTTTTTWYQRLWDWIKNLFTF